jgi:hypothetical protein
VIIISVKKLIDGIAQPRFFDLTIKGLSSTAIVLKGNNLNWMQPFTVCMVDFAHWFCGMSFDQYSERAGTRDKRPMHFSFLEVRKGMCKNIENM